MDFEVTNSAPGQNHVRLVWISTRNIWEYAQTAYEVLPRLIRARISSKKTLRDRENALGSQILQRYALSEKFTLDLDSFANMGFTYSETGKPSYSDPYSHVHYNVSHDGGKVILAKSTAIVGVDLLEISNYSSWSYEDYMESFRQVLSDGEWNTIKQASDRLLVFLKLWSLKEAYVKATGEGISDDLTRIECSFESFNEKNSENYIVSSPSGLWHGTVLLKQGFIIGIVSEKKFTWDFYDVTVGVKSMIKAWRNGDKTGTE